MDKELRLDKFLADMGKGHPGAPKAVEGPGRGQWESHKKESGYKGKILGIR